MWQVGRERCRAKTVPSLRAFQSCNVSHCIISNKHNLHELPDPSPVGSAFHCCRNPRGDRVDPILEVPAPPTTRTRVVGEGTKPNDCSHVAGRGMQGRGALINRLFGNEFALIAQSILLAF